MTTNGLSTREALLSEARAALLNALGDFFHEFGFTSPEAIEGLRRGARDSFDELAGIKDKRGFEQARGLTASRISLVHEEDLEFSIRLSDLSRRLRERCEGPLGKLHLRFMTLLDQTDPAAEQLPVGPETVCCGIRALTDAADIAPDERIELLERVESGLGHRLAALYTRLNRLLEDAGIQPQTLGRPESSGAARQAPPGGGLGSVGPTAAAQQPSGALAELQRALLTRQAAAQRNAVSADPQLSAMLAERVLAWLTDQQSSASGAAQRLGASEVGPLIAPESRANIDAVERIFDAIIAATRLPVAAKGAMARLRIPLLKLAVLDPALLTDPADPARRLIDTIGSACVGLAADTSPNHPVCWAISETAARIQKKFDRDVLVFASELPKLESIVAVRLTAVKERAAGFIAQGAKLERAAIALRFASRAIRALESGNPPAPVRAFLENHWLRVLQNTLVLRGEKSNEWRNQLAVADRLVWSVQPKTTAEDRSHLLKLLPELLRRMHAGLAELGLAEAARNAALAPCMDIHTSLMHGRNMADLELPAYAGATVELRLDPVPDASGLRVLHMSGFIASEPTTPNAIDKLKAGDWLDLALPDGRRVHGRIGWIGQARQVLLLVDPDRQGVLAITQRALIQQWETGLARALPEVSLFEQAASDVLKSL